MVCCAASEKGGSERVTKSMAMGPERSKTLHNFTLPCLKWGNQRYLRCMKLMSDGSDVSGSDRIVRSSELENSPESLRREKRDSQWHVFTKDLENQQRASKSKIIDRSRDNGDEADGIDAVREKLMFDLKTAADKMKDAILREEVAEEGKNNSTEVVSAGEVRPWNLRMRRATCKAQIGGDGRSKALKIEERNGNQNPPVRIESGVKSPRIREESEKKERVKFSVSVSKKEIEDDFVEMLGRRPPRRPKKRPRIVQNQLDTLFPGLWLTEITADSYKVAEFPGNCKR